MAEETKDYSKGWLGNMLDGGARARLMPKVDGLEDAQTMLKDAEYATLLGAGVSQAEADAYKAEREDQIAADYESNSKAVSSLSTTNTIINVASLTPIALKGVSKASSKVASSLSNSSVGSTLSNRLSLPGSTTATTAGELAKEGTTLIKNGHVLKGVGTYAKAGTKLLGTAATKAGKAFDAVDDKLQTLGEKIAGTTEKTTVWKEVSKDVFEQTTKRATRLPGALGVMQKAVGATVSKGAYIAPVVAAQMYTRGRVDKMDKELSDAITLVLDRTDYINTEGGKLTSEAGEAYNAWNDNYSLAMEDLSSRLDNGEITQAEFDQLYEEQAKAQAEALKELDETYPEMARQMVTEGEAYRVADTGAEIGADLDAVGKRDSQVKDLMTEYPEAKALYEEKSEKLAELDTGSSFSNFITSMHAALIHYLPGFSYLEATAVKVADVALGFVANKVPVLSDVLNYEEHYKGQSITSMASQIVDTAEARYEKQSEADAVSDELEAKQTSWKDAAEELRGTDGLQAAPC